MKRETLKGRELKEYPEEVKMTISSKCPGKWLFIDLEDGNIWRWDVKNETWRYAVNKNRIKELKRVIKFHEEE